MKSVCTPLSALLYFCAFHSPTAVTHPWLLLKLPPPIVEITHWKQVVAVTSWLLTVRVDSPTPPGRALPWEMKGPLVTSELIYRLDIEASPVTSQFGRTMVLLNWHVTVNMIGAGWLPQNGTFWGSLVYPTCMEQMYTHRCSVIYIFTYIIYMAQRSLRYITARKYVKTYLKSKSTSLTDLQERSRAMRLGCKFAFSVLHSIYLKYSISHFKK